MKYIIFCDTVADNFCEGGHTNLHLIFQGFSGKFQGYVSHGSLLNNFTQSQVCDANDQIITVIRG